MTFEAGSSLSCGCPAPRGTFSSVPGLQAPDANSPVATKAVSPDTARCPLGGKTAPVENHCLERIEYLENL